MEELLLQDDRTLTAIATTGAKDLSKGIGVMASEMKSYCFFMINSAKINDFYSEYAEFYNNHLWSHDSHAVILNPNFRVNTEMYSDFLIYKGYADNWDGENGCAMTKEVSVNFEQVYHLLSMDAIHNMILSLDYNGTLLLETMDGNGGIEIGNKAYTYHYFEDDKLEGEEHLPFNAQEVASIANRFAERR